VLELVRRWPDERKNTTNPPSNRKASYPLFGVRHALWFQHRKCSRMYSLFISRVQITYGIPCAITLYAIELAPISLRSNHGRKNPQAPRDLDPAIHCYRPHCAFSDWDRAIRHARGKVLYLLWKCRKVQMLLWPSFAGRADGLLRTWTRSQILPEQLCSSKQLFSFSNLCRDGIRKAERRRALLRRWNREWAVGIYQLIFTFV